MKYAPLIGLVLVAKALGAQTPNDNMENAADLILNKALNSYTHKNTVQPTCVDESLTGKCIKYHNDQWFTFNTGNFTHLFINISSQKCRDLQGVQLVVIEGKPCQPSTYTILDCVSLATQDDIFVAVRNLKKFQTYWLNVDGYLHDFCSFNIEISDKPAGFSAKQYTWLKSKGTSESNIVTLQWTVPDSLSHNVKSVHVMKRNVEAFRFQPFATVPVVFNAYGDMQTAYQFTDTLLAPGKYYYRLVVEQTNGGRYFADEFFYNIYPGLTERENGTITVQLSYRDNTSLSVLIIDAVTSEVVDRMKFYFEPKKHSNFILYTNRYLVRGMDMIEVHVINDDDNHRKIHYFKLDSGSN